MMEPMPQIVGYLNGEPVYEISGSPPAPEKAGPGPQPQQRPITLVKLFHDLVEPIENFEHYFEVLKARLDACARREQEAGISPTPPSAERHRLHQQIALVSTSITYLRSLLTSARILFADWTHE